MVDMHTLHTSKSELITVNYIIFPPYSASLLELQMAYFAVARQKRHCEVRSRLIQKTRDGCSRFVLVHQKSNKIEVGRV